MHLIQFVRSQIRADEELTLETLAHGIFPTVVIFICQYFFSDPLPTDEAQQLGA